MKKVMMPILAIAVAYSAYAGFALHAGAAEPRAAAKAPTADAGALELKRQQLEQREAALRAREEELGRLSATLEARVAELNAARRGIEATLAAKKKQDGERHKKMINIYKGLKPEQAGALLNKLDDKMVIEMLNQMDQKTAVRLIPHITQPRVLEWTRLNLGG
jgi:flagellar protein FlbB